MDFLKRNTIIILTSVVMTIVLLSIIPIHASSPILVQSGLSGSCTTTTCSITFGSSVTSGNLLIVEFSGDSKTSCITFSNPVDTIGSVLSITKQASNIGTKNCWETLIISGIAGGTGTDTITVSYSGDVIDKDFMWYFELNGITNISPQTSSGSGTACNLSTGTLSYSTNSFLIEVFSQLGGTTKVYTTGFVENPGLSGIIYNGAYENFASSSGSTNFPITCLAGNDWVEISAVFAPSTVTTTTTQTFTTTQTQTQTITVTSIIAATSTITNIVTTSTTIISPTTTTQTVTSTTTSTTTTPTTTTIISTTTSPTTTTQTSTITQTSTSTVTTPTTTTATSTFTSPTTTTTTTTSTLTSPTTTTQTITQTSTSTLTTPTTTTQTATVTTPTTVTLTTASPTTTTQTFTTTTTMTTSPTTTAIITTVSPKTTETTTQTIISSTTMTETLTRTSTIATTQTLLISDVITSAETYNYTHTITIARGAIIMKTTTVQGIQGINLPNLSVDNVSSNINSNVSSIVTVTAGLSVVAIVIGKSLLARGRRSRGK